MRNAAIDVLLVDDESIIRESVRRELKKSGDFRAIEEAVNGREALDKIGQVQVVILDLSLPVLSGEQVLARIREVQPELPVLMFSSYPEVPYALRLLRAGASGYMPKNAGVAHLAEALRTLRGGHIYITPALKRLIASLFISDPLRTVQAVFSDLEMQVLRDIAHGQPADAIRRKLAPRKASFEVVRTRLLDLTRTADEAALAAWAVDNRVV